MVQRVNSSYIEPSFYNWIDREGDFSTLVFIPLDLAAVPSLRQTILDMGKKSGLDEEQNFHIALISDELATNAIVATYSSAYADYIMLQITFKPEMVVLMIYDYGGGFSREEVEAKVPEGDNLQDFVESLNHYRESSQPAFVPLRGEIIEHNRFGRGLRIVAGLAEEVNVSFHNEKNELSRSLNSNTVGTIIEVIYRYGVAIPA